MRRNSKRDAVLGLGLLAAAGMLASGCSPAGNGQAPAKAGTAKGTGAEAAPGEAGKTAAAGSAAAAAPAAAATTPGAGGLGKPELEAKAKQAMRAGLAWLKTQQAPDGSYGGPPGVTGMVLEAILKSPDKPREADGPFVAKAVQYLTSMAKPNGAIFDKNLPTYNTALSLLALQATENPAYKPLIKKGQDFLIGVQAAEQNHYTEKDKFYGGIGYGNSERPDLPNLQYAIEALAETNYDGDKGVYKRALHFLERCQNRSESNDQPWAGNDGGFVYTVGDSKVKDSKTASYGSMTYAGLMSLMYVDVDRNDPRVQDAIKWVRSHWDLETHPGMGDTGLYFYYDTMAKALAVYGSPTIEDVNGRSHDWAAELIQAVLSRQKPEGYWVNTNPEYWEGNKPLCTARAMLALESALGLNYLAKVAPPVPAATAPAAGQGQQGAAVAAPAAPAAGDKPATPPAAPAPGK